MENIFSNLALQSVDESLKPIVRELLTYVNKDIKFYTQNQIQRIIKDLQSGDLRIYVASKDKDSPNYDERYASGKKFNGHSGPDEEECLRTGVYRKRIVLAPEELIEGPRSVLVTLSHEFEHYVCLDDEAVKANLNMRKFSKEYFKNVPPSEFKKLPRQGGFLGSLFSEKWLRIWDEASTEIVSTLLVDSNPTAYRPCIYFLATAVVINKKNINDLKLARRSGNVDFLYSLVPKNILEDISVIGLALLRNRNNTVFLERLNQRLGDYYSFLEEAGKLSSYSNFEKSQIKDTIFEYSRIGFNKDEAEKNSFRKNVFRKLSKNSEIDR